MDCDKDIYQQCLEKEKNYLEYLNQHGVDFNIYNVSISIGYIHTIMAKPKIAIKNPIYFVLLHGFSGNLVNWRNLIPELTKEGHYVYAIDQLGWGLSSRPQTFSNDNWSSSNQTVENVVDFWVDSLEEWRQTQQILEIHLVGYSLGGWIAGEYSLRYPKFINTLTLVCSIGVYPYDKTWFTNKNNILNSLIDIPKSVLGVNWPFQLIRLLDFITINYLFDNLSNKEYWKKYIDYIRIINQLPPSGEIVTEYIRKRRDPNYSHVLWDRLYKMRFPVNFIYFENDTLVESYNPNLLNQLYNSPYVSINTIGYRSGHSSKDPNVIKTLAAIILGRNNLIVHRKNNPESIVFSMSKL